jgi:hypothetical protein
MYQGLYKDYASHGYLVVALDHHDGSCIYAEAVGYKKRDFYDKEFRTSQCEQRSDEILDLFEEVADLPATVLEEPEAEVNMSELILGGHSFGGITQLLTATRLTKAQLKAVWVFDPWMFPLHEDFSSGKLRISVPTIIISSGSFNQELKGL